MEKLTIAKLKEKWLVGYSKIKKIINK
jgi:hypothetical protein